MPPRTEKTTRIVELKADATDYSKAMRKVQEASAKTATAMTGMWKTAQKTETSVTKISRSMTKFSNALNLLGGVYILNQIAGLAQAFFNFGRNIAEAEEQMTLFTLRLERLGTVGGLGNVALAADLAEELGITFADAADNIQLLAPAFEKLGIPFRETTRFAENFTKALRVFGTDARRAQIITVQLAQALSSGQLSGDELRSLTENAGGLGRELEKAVQDILGTDKALKQLGEEGALTAKVVLEGLQEVFKNLRGDMENLPVLFSQSLARMDTAWQRLKASIADQTGWGEGVKVGIDAVTDAMNDQALRNALNAFQDDLASSLATFDTSTLIRALNELEDEYEEVAERRARYQELGADKYVGRTNQEMARLSRQIQVLVGETGELTRRWEDFVDAISTEIADIENPFQQWLRPFLNEKYEIKPELAFDPDVGNINAAIAAITKEFNLSTEAARNLEKMFPVIAEQARKSGISISLALAQAFKESAYLTDFDTDLSSATGPFQIIEATAKELADKYNLSYKLIREGGDNWAENIRAGILYLAEQVDATGTELEGLAQYFLGPGGFRQYGLDIIEPNNGITARTYAQRIITTQTKIQKALGLSNAAQEEQLGLVKRGADLARQYASIQDEYVRKMNEALKVRQAGALTESDYMRTVAGLTEEYQRNVDRLFKANNQLSESEKEKQREQRKAASILMGLREPYEVITDKIKLYDEWLRKQVVTQAEYNKLISGAAVEYAKARDLKFVDKGGDATKEAKGLVEGLRKSFGEIEDLSASIGETLGDSLGNAFDQAIDGALNLKSLLTGILKDIAKLAIRFATSSLFNTIFPTAASTAAAGAQTVSTTTTNNMIQPLSINVAPASVPYVRTVDRQSGSSDVSGSGVIVNINESADTESQGSVKQRQDNQGRTILDIVVAKVREDLARDVRYGRGLAGIMEQQYGLSRARGAY